MLLEVINQHKSGCCTFFCGCALQLWFNYQSDEFFRGNAEQQLVKAATLICLISYHQTRSLQNTASFIPHLYFLLQIFCIILSICLVYGKTLKTLILLFVAFSGFCASFLLAFSPTVYASGDRTLYPLYLALLFVVFGDHSRFDLVDSKYKKLAFSTDA
ncbi:MAG: hypothetical protein LBP35_07250 [Candidatus Ancillula trichonymphae]|jgi:hypothetical protein|nr:hypothetical protein [Candidatus Ancillula trichonymphae]